MTSPGSGSAGSGSMSGKTVLVTGATGGIGQVAARTLVERGGRVIIIGRNAEKTARVARDIGAADFIIADLSVQAEVRRAAAEFRDRSGQLDVLLNNAGMIYMKREESRDGIEMTWALNHLGYFLLTTELLDLIKSTPHARVVSVSSAAHEFGRIHWNDPEFRHGYSSWAAYGQSKLANILFTRELAYRLRSSAGGGTTATANALHPGMVATGFGQQNSGLAGLGMALLRPFSKTDVQGAQTSIYLASSPEVEGLTGLYFSNERVTPTTAQALDDAAAARLWALSEDYVSGSVPGAKSA